MSKHQEANIDYRVFLPAAIVTFGLIALAALFPDAGDRVSSTLYNWVIFRLDWMFQIGGLITLIFLVWLAFGKYGQIKLGDKDDKPEFTKLSYISMIFTAGVGSGLIYWALAEPIYYMAGPPFGLEPNSLSSAIWFVSYPMFHWGLTGWAIYCIPAIPVAYSFYVRKHKKLRLSTAAIGIIGEDRANGPLGVVIDVLGVFGVFGGVGTGLGFASTLISTSLNAVFGLPDTLALQLFILLLYAVIFTTSIYLGLYKGLQRLAKFNVYAAFAFLIFVVVVGPTAFIFSFASESFYAMFQNYLAMSLWTDPINQSGFPQYWTVFYWAWYFAYLLMMGLFLARISKGRTIKETITTVLIFGSLGCWTFIIPFGSYTVYAWWTGLVPVLDIYNTAGVTSAIVAVFSSLPFASFVLLFFTMVQLVFMSTTVDTSAYSIACSTSKDLTEGADQEPSRINRVIWAFALAGAGALTLLIGGDLQSIQSLTVVAGLPMALVALLINISLMKCLKEDFGKALDKEVITLETINKKDSA